MRLQLKKKKKGKSRTTIPTASMADIAFLLIIFFMLTTSFSPVKTSVELPDSFVRTEVEQNAAIVAITVDNELVFSDGESPGFEVASAGELGPYVESLVRLIPNKQFIIKADREVHYIMVDRVLEQLRNHGAQFIGLLTEQRTSPALN